MVNVVFKDQERIKGGLVFLNKELSSSEASALLRLIKETQHLHYNGENYVYCETVLELSSSPVSIDELCIYMEGVNHD